MSSQTLLMRCWKRMEPLFYFVDTELEAYRNAKPGCGQYDHIQSAEEWVKQTKLTKNLISDAIPGRLKKRSFIRSTSYLLRDVLYLALNAGLFSLVVGEHGLLDQWSADNVHNNNAMGLALAKFCLFTIYGLIQGTIFFGLWLQGHECGHHAYCENDTVSDIVGFFAHGALGLPYFAWQYSHSKHHKNTNHMVSGESHVPLVEIPEYLRDGVYLLGADVFSKIWAVVLLTIGWPAYLLDNASGGVLSWSGKHLDFDGGKYRLDHFRAYQSDLFPPQWHLRITIGTIGMLAYICGLCYWSYEYGFAHMFAWYFFPKLINDAWLTMITILHHTHEDVPHLGNDAFSWLRGALSTIDRPYPMIIDNLHHHIGSTHVLHHFDSKIPHYNAQEATQILRKLLGPKLYRYDDRPVFQALFETVNSCAFVDSREGSVFYRKMDEMPVPSKLMKSADKTLANMRGSKKGCKPPAVGNANEDKRAPKEQGGLGAKKNSMNRTEKSEKANSSQKSEKMEMLIGDKIYDVSGFAKAHPGGSIIKFSIGTDATDTFREFHYRSEKAHKILNVLPSRQFNMEVDGEKFITRGDLTRAQAIKAARKVDPNAESDSDETASTVESDSPRSPRDIPSVIPSVSEPLSPTSSAEAEHHSMRQRQQYVQAETPREATAVDAKLIDYVLLKDDEVESSGQKAVPQEGGTRALKKDMIDTEAMPKKQHSEEEMDPLVRDFRILRQQMEEEGYFEPSILHVTYRIVELVLMHAMGVAILWMNNSSSNANNMNMDIHLDTNNAIASLLVKRSVDCLGLLLLGVAQGRCGWFMHEGGHCSLTGNFRTDRRIQEFFYGVGCGMAASWWRNQHNKHHATPQRLEYDVDLSTLPLVAFNKRVLETTKEGRRLLQSTFYRTYWLPFQNYLFSPVICLLVSLFWQLYLHPRHALRTKNYIELVYMATRYSAMYAFGTYVGASVPQICLAYMAYLEVGGCYIFTNFSVSHTHLPVTEADEVVSWVDYAADHTMNCDNHWFTNWWMSYLNFQVEHHLFPQLPQFRAPRVSRKVQLLFEKHGKSYLTMPYFEAVRHTMNNLHEVGQVAQYDAVKGVKAQ